MTHNIPTQHIEKLTKAPSPTKISQVSNLQNFIQKILGDTHYTFLQGSYKNDTSISDINDVDIVAIRLTTYSGVYSNIQLPDRIIWDTIFTEIENKLKNQNLYQWTITRGDKCIKIETSSFSADVVPAVQVEKDYLVDPIVIYSFRDGIEKVNYPRVHWKNGIEKHENTNQNFKPMVRMFKNWTKNHFENSPTAPSYHVESLVYGADNKCFSNDHASSFILIADNITKKLNNRNVLPIKIPSVCGSEDITVNWPLIHRQNFNNKLLLSLNNALSAYQHQNIYNAEQLWKRTFNL
jgi:hypothetical protein